MCFHISSKDEFIQAVAAGLIAKGLNKGFRPVQLRMQTERSKKIFDDMVAHVREQEGWRSASTGKMFSDEAKRGLARAKRKFAHA